MTDLLVVVPTRGRPGNAARLATAIDDTSQGATSVVFAVDDDDPCLDDYRQALTGRHLAFHPRLSMIAKLNHTANERAGLQPYIGFMGDDHLPLTPGWDTAIIDALHAAPGPGIVYPNDLFQGAALPTSVFMHSLIVRTLSWMALPTLEHLYCDNVWLDLGQRLGSCTYLDDVVIEHLHPHAGKADGDAQYDRVNSTGRHDADRAAWHAWQDKQRDRDVARILEAVRC